MPSWIVHIGTSYLFFKKSKYCDFRLIIIGAILPDIFRFTYVIFLDVFDFKPEFIITYFEPFATPFMTLFLALIVSLFTKRPLKSFIILFLLSIFHFFLDSFQKQIGYYNLFLYPFSFKNINFELLMIDHPFFIILNFLFLPILIYMLIRQKNTPLFIFKTQRLKYIILLVVFVFIFPIFTKELFYKNNFHYLQFYQKPLNWNNKKVEMCYCKVIKQNPLTVEEMGKKFIIANSSNNYKVGDFISIIGIYKNNKVYAKYIYKHLKFQKAIFSLIALFLIFLLFIKSYLVKRSRLNGKKLL